MNNQDRFPVTPAIRILKQAGIVFTNHSYDYEEHGGTATSSTALGVDEHCVIKTLIFEDDLKNPFIVLMHGDREVSTKNLSRFLKVKSVCPSAPAVAQKHSGYFVGGTSPFGTRRKLPVYMEKTILELDRIYINGGHRGYLVGLTPGDLVAILQPVLVEVGIPSKI